MVELQEVVERVEEYHNTVLSVKDYLRYNEIDEQAKILYFLLMGIVWTATKRNESITDADANVWLNLDDGTVQGIDGVETVPEMASVPLEDFLDYLRTTYLS